jgi:hypothetical protein
MLSIFLALALISDPVSAMGKAAESATAAEAPAATEEKKICRRVDATESRMKSQRVCKTAAEWKKHQKDLDAQRY